MKETKRGDHRISLRETFTKGFRGHRVVHIAGVLAATSSGSFGGLELKIGEEKGAAVLFTLAAVFILGTAVSSFNTGREITLRKKR